MAPSRQDPDAFRRLRRLGEACLWLIVIAVVVIGVVELLSRLRVVTLGVGLAIVLATVLRPVVRRLASLGLPDGVAAIVTLMLALVVLGGVGFAIVPPTVDRIGALDVSVSRGLERVENWLADGPLPLSDEQAASAIQQLQDEVASHLGSIADSALGGAALTLEVLAGLSLAVVLLFFFLKDGPRLWEWLVGLAPPGRRSDVDEVGRRSWDALGGFVRGQTLVALFDAVFIGIALFVLDVPLVLPLAVLTFVGAFVPIVGAVVAGAAAALVALVASGFGTALLVVAAVIVVQQLEGNVFQPVVVGRATHVHPVAILVGVAAGGVLAGILGALVAAPVIAVGSAVLGFLRERSDGPVESPERSGRHARPPERGRAKATRGAHDLG